jgi:hypothetical protein
MRQSRFQHNQQSEMINGFSSHESAISKSLTPGSETFAFILADCSIKIVFNDCIEGAKASTASDGVMAQSNQNGC